jgi:hypothetical protein
MLVAAEALARRIPPIHISLVILLSRDNCLGCCSSSIVSIASTIVVVVVVVACSRRSSFPFE